MKTYNVAIFHKAKMVKFWRNCTKNDISKIPEYFRKNNLSFDYVNVYLRDKYSSVYVTRIYSDNFHSSLSNL